MKYALLIASLVFSSCGSLPKKPEVSNCIMIVELELASCFNNQTGEEVDVPFMEMDKYVAFSPEDWTEVLTYIRLLERFRTTRKETKKFLNSYRLNEKRVEELVK